MQEQLGSVQRDGNSKKNQKKMLEIKSNVSEMEKSWMGLSIDSAAENLKRCQRGKSHFTYRRTRIKITVYLSEIIQPNKEWN